MSRKERFPLSVDDAWLKVSGSEVYEIRSGTIRLHGGDCPTVRGSRRGFCDVHVFDAICFT